MDARQEEAGTFSFFFLSLFSRFPPTVWNNSEPHQSKKRRALQKRIGSDGNVSLSLPPRSSSLTLTPTLPDRRTVIPDNTFMSHYFP